MKKEDEIFEKELKSFAEEFLKKTENKEILIMSHFDTDGITSASIIISTLKKLDRKFSIRILKNLEEKTIKGLPKDKIIFFLDLASGSLEHIKNNNLKDVFIIDHHEISQKIPENVRIINPHLTNKQKISTSGLAYLFAKQIIPEAKELSKLAILGMIGDCLEKEIDSLNHGILEESGVQRKRGLLIYPSTRPLNRVLEYSSNPYIPEVTGNLKGVLEILRESGIIPERGKYKSIMELDEKEMKNLTTSILLRNPKIKSKDLVGDIFLIKMFNKIEDARDLSAIINACSRSGRPELAIQYCLEIPKSKKEAELAHIKYKQNIITGLNFVQETKKIQGKGFVIINAQDNVKDTMIGTIASIISNSSIYEEGTIITTMAYYEDKIKVSSRIVGRKGRNLRELLASVTNLTGGESGGHEHAAGCLISRKKEREFIDILKKNLEIELIKI
ncbi:MAG: DHH family protein [Candidatus Diapherotrites archaeon ADurb.Bin253]|jgi:RecJ-like exonuclease|nr:DHH family phosphoesterase [Candidatus Pacearchaeota archaeon]OQA69173.1 MAG: DHH family protein [Candidatus Diapherotrites archaeon ADurb.Bin253]HNZ51967.1 DHH family phosphoesterase [Candidatus Pacearchaeota archaeon]HOC96694.1 DHH family phosphoesterase [Candidatus Pacearchaeota archaeon]HOH04046.1 DHH family phosphoesterase [Candidatus Pacearchaeota archaeon]